MQFRSIKTDREGGGGEMSINNLGERERQTETETERQRVCVFMQLRFMRDGWSVGRVPIPTFSRSSHFLTYHHHHPNAIDHHQSDT